MTSGDNISGLYRNPSILQVLPSLSSGGVERGTIDVALKLVAEGYGSFVTSSGGVQTQKLKIPGCTHIKKPMSSKNPIVMLKNYYSLLKIIDQNSIDLLHARSRAPAWSAYYAARKRDIPFLTTFHGIYRTPNALKRYYNSVMTKGDLVVAVSEFVKQHIMHNYGTPEEKIRVIHRGIDQDYFDPAKITNEKLNKYCEKYHLIKDSPVILLPSRMTEWKGQFFLIKALNKIRDLDFRCLIVGDLSRHPAYVSRLKKYITDLKLQSKIQIFGPESEMLGLYGISDIVLSTSIEPEAFGRTIVEAQAMKKLTIATNIGGGAETVIDSINGFHVVPGDAEDLADKLRYCLSILGSSTADTITDAARRNACDHFSLKHMLDQSISVYKELL